MGVLERMQAGWRIRRETRWWVPDFCGPTIFVWFSPVEARGAELSETEWREMRKLGRTKVIGPISEHPDAAPPYVVIGPI